MKIAFTDQFIKLFVGHAGETGDVVHVEQGIIGTQQYAVVACCGQHGHNVLCEIYEGCANAGNLLSCAFRAGLLRIPRITGEVTGFRITHTTMIAGEIKRFMRDDGMIKVSRSIKENSFKINKAVNEYMQKYGKEPTVLTLCEETGLSKEDIVMALEATTEVESIYKTVPGSEGNDQFLVDKLAGKKDEDEKIINKVLLGQLLNTLGGVEKELLRLRYFEDKTQVQVAQILGISQVQVSRLEKKILMGLRKAARP